MKEDLTDITIILDRSGSMETVRADTIGGFNAFLAEQKAVPGAATLSLVQFDNEYETVHSVTRIQDVPELTAQTFVPRGSTALLDAIGRTVIATGARLAALPEADRPGKVLLVIMTDGQENASAEFTRPQIFDMITHQREKYQWQIAFIGANQDAIATGKSYGIPASNSANYAHTGDGTRAIMAEFSASTTRYRGIASAPSAGFFDPDDDPAETKESAPSRP